MFSKSLAIIQPAYIPWKGYFDFIASVDEFVLLDNVDFVRRTWYSRNCLKQRDGGTKWLSIPVEYSQSNPTTIHHTPVRSGFAASHLNFIKAQYSKAPFFERYFPAFESKLLSLESSPFLSNVTIPLIEWLAEELGISTPIIKASELDACGKATDRLLDICIKRGATNYVSGPAAKSYLQQGLFRAQNITVDWMDYSGYMEYAQFYPPFSHSVSVLDLLLMMGPDAVSYMKYVKPRAS